MIKDGNRVGRNYPQVADDRNYYSTAGKDFRNYEGQYDEHYKNNVSDDDSVLRMYYESKSGNNFN